MHNVSHTIEGNELVIRVKVDAASVKAAPPSSTGKTHAVGSTGGFVAIAVPGISKPVSFSVNVNVKP